MAYDVIGFIGFTSLCYNDIIEEKYDELEALLKRIGHTEKLEELEVNVTGNPVPAYNGGYWEPSEAAYVEDMTVEITDDSKETLEKITELRKQYQRLVKMGNALRVDLKKAEIVFIRKVEKLRRIDITDYLTKTCLEKIEEAMLLEEQTLYNGGGL